MNQASRREDVWGSGGIAMAFLTSSIDGREWSDSRRGRFTTDTHWIGGQVGGLDAVELFLPGIELHPSSP
jgi:hypothetical protein